MENSVGRLFQASSLRSIDVPFTVFTGLHDRVAADSLHTLLLRSSRAAEHNHVLTVATLSAVRSPAARALPTVPEPVLPYTAGSILLGHHVGDIC